MIELKLLTTEHMDSMLSVCQNFHQESPYSHISLDIEKTKKLLEGFRTAKMDEKVCLLMVSDNVVVGALAAIRTEYLFSSEFMASEILFYIYPEFRHYRYAKFLHDAFLGWARHFKCKDAQLAFLPSKDLTKLYTRWGYTPAESIWTKRLED